MGMPREETRKHKLEIPQALPVIRERSPDARAVRHHGPSKKALFGLGLVLLVFFVIERLLVLRLDPAVYFVGAMVYLTPSWTSVLPGLAFGLFYSLARRTESRERWRVAVGVPLAGILWGFLGAIVLTLPYWPRALFIAAFTTLMTAPFVFAPLFVGIGVGLHLIPNSSLPE